MKTETDFNILVSHKMSVQGESSIFASITPGIHFFTSEGFLSVIQTWSTPSFAFTSNSSMKITFRRGERVNPNVSTHVLELAPENRVLSDLVAMLGRKLLQLSAERFQLSRQLRTKKPLLTLAYDLH